ncbi:putative Lipopolysaccharide biosynthesis protein [Nitrospira sp. ND1]|jgi:succinoglycan biosynthesis transport protein ExoP|uniref:GumC family protein n=1 Tax=Nitrospira sp. ND1 TaxID=1658518 RepID=UPI0009B9ABF8|nr:Wzz/FepE/Etk N-terminal domain-containing protein [Nitrospira sp. ND1]SLM42033.1 putative Lipopolysaccharide biosynthesis protein [Nitrospira sp. ND1]
MTGQPRSQEPEATINLGDYLAIFKRRRTVIFFVAGFLLCLSLAAAVLWPPTFKSTATILIEEQEVPAELVHSTITSYADQRIEMIKQQVMSRSSLWKVVEQYNLYPEMRRENPTEEVIKRFIKDIEVEVISADVIDKRTQHATKATIAFTVSYNSGAPDTAQRVANELTSLFLGENLKSRERQAQETTTFLKQEAESLAAHIEEVEAKLATFKQRAAGALPELMPLNLQMMNQSDRELMDLDQQIRSLEERKSYLDGELATIKPNTPILSVTGERILDSVERLRGLRAEYAGVAANLSSDHPDVIKMKQEISALERETGANPETEEVAKQLIDARARQATLADRLGENHPDVLQTQRTIVVLERELRRIGTGAGNKPMQRPENPAYINIQAQLNSVNSSLQALKTSRTTVKQRLQDYAKRIERTPVLEPDYLTLARDRDTSSQKYQDIRSRLLEAKVSEGLEVQRKGERFSLIDPPGLPESPEKPNRKAIVLLGFILALAGGAGAAALTEHLDHSIRTPEQLVRVSQAFPLAVIPYMPNRADLARALARRNRIRLTGLGTVALLVLICHLFWTPLDVVWFAALRRFGIE